MTPSASEVWVLVYFRDNIVQAEVFASRDSAYARHRDLLSAKGLGAIYDPFTAPFRQ